MEPMRVHIFENRLLAFECDVESPNVAQLLQSMQSCMLVMSPSTFKLVKLVISYYYGVTIIKKGF